MRIVIRLFLVFYFSLFFINTAQAGGSYLNLKFPIIGGATDIVNAVDERLFIKSVEYDVKVREVNDLHTFYSKYFKNVGWENPMNNFPKMAQKIGNVWQSFHVKTNEDNSTVLLYGSMWSTDEIPAVATLQVKVLNYLK